jgi:hypothetical protein
MMPSPFCVLSAVLDGFTHAFTLIGLYVSLSFVSSPSSLYNASHRFMFLSRDRRITSQLA